MFRRYNRWHARFDQPDPYEGSYDLSDPQSFNRYSYTQGDPVNFVDPSGLLDYFIPAWQNGWGQAMSPTLYFLNQAMQDFVADYNWFASEDEGYVEFDGFQPISFGYGGSKNPDKYIASAVDRARAILSTKNPCSDFFGDNAVKALNTLEAILTRGYPNGPGDTKLGIQQSGPQTVYGQPVEYRSYQKAVINNAGPFFNLNSTTRIGGYGPGSNRSQVLQLLHEVAHLVYKNGATLIPDDAGRTKKVDSDVNTREILKHCKGEIDKIKN